MTMPSSRGDSEELARRVTELEAENRHLRDLLGCQQRSKTDPFSPVEN